MLNRIRFRGHINLYRAIFLSIIAAVLIALSFHGGLDHFARTHIVETTTESTGIYLVSQTINASISILQTTEVQVPLLSAQVGEILDPLNDAIERLSSMLVWAIGSLFFQRILLEVASSSAFKWILVSISLVTIAILFLPESDRFRVFCRKILSNSDFILERCRDLFVRVFVIAAIIRFIIPSFIAVSFLVTQLFLGSEITTNKEELSLIEKKLHLSKARSLQKMVEILMNKRHAKNPD